MAVQKRENRQDNKISIFNHKKVIELFEQNDIKIMNLQKIYKLLIKDGKYISRLFIKIKCLNN